MTLASNFTLVVIVIMVSVIVNAQCAKILYFTFTESKSEKNVYEPLLLELANRGHKITHVTPIQGTKKYPNITEVLGIPYNELTANTGVNLFEARLRKEMVIPYIVRIPMYQKFVPKFLKLPQIQEVLKQQFDLVFTSTIFNECIFGILHHFKAPYIFMSSIAAPDFYLESIGNPTPWSVSPLFLLGMSHKMTFWERVQNVIANVALDLNFKFNYHPKMEKIYREHFGQDTPSVEEIKSNASLIFSNSHFSLQSPKALLPQVIEIGGMHCRPAKTLPKDLNDFLSDSDQDGFIYFSFGSIVRGNQMPMQIRNTFLKVFSQLKQKVIWKWESEMLDVKVPPNIKLQNWLPQQDILGHPSIRLIITHGGLLSIEEAVYHGVPLIGFPINSDQGWNMKMAQDHEFAISLDIGEITEEGLLKAINKILNEPRFMNKAKSLSSTYKDRPLSPLETAVYWTEYILRHNGAPHLQSHAAKSFNFLQYHSTDVLAFIFTLIILIIFLIIKLLKFIFLKICFSKNTPRVKQD